MVGFAHRTREVPLRSRTIRVSGSRWSRLYPRQDAPVHDVVRTKPYLYQDDPCGATFLKSTRSPTPSVMDNIAPSDALLFPADARIPHLVQLTSSTMMSSDQTTGQTIAYRIPHPQVHMNYIATNTPHRVWDSKVITNIPYARNFQYPYVVYFPVISQSGAPFPVNQNLREIQGRNFKEADPWRGDIVVAKYWDHPYGTLMDCAMSDYPLIKNWLFYHSPGNSYA